MLGFTVFYINTLANKKDSFKRISGFENVSKGKTKNHE